MVNIIKNGVTIGDKYLLFTPERGVLSEVTNTLTKVGNSDGSVLMDSTLNSRIIPIKFDFRALKRREFEVKLAPLIYSKEIEEWSFDDRPNEVWYGKIDGKIDLDRAFMLGTGTINLLVPDGHSHAKKTKTATNNGGKTIEFVNEGTDATPIKVTAKMKSDNGFLGLSLNGRYYQVGKPEEVNGVQLPPSQQLVSDGLSEFSKGVMNDPKNNPLPGYMGHLSQTGTITKNANGIEVTSYGTSSDKSWAGPSITWKFPATTDGHVGAKNLFLWQNAWFETEETNQAGFQVHTISDANGKRLFTVLLIDQSSTTIQSKIICFVNDKLVYEAKNNWTGTGYKGFMSMTKAGNNFVVVYGNTQKTFVDTTLTDSEAVYYTVGYGSWYNNPTPHKSVLINWSLTRNQIDSWVDIPNFFKTGDEVVLNSASNEMTINSVKDWDRVDIGSKPLLAAVGNNSLGIIVSDWATTPDVRIEYRERWL